MLFIHKTVSLCDHCYAHIPGNVIENNNLIKLIKRCPEHGEMTSIIEIDKEFYYSLNHAKIESRFNNILFEASDKCQLTCPHCYHLPDNQTQDRPVEEILAQVSTFPRQVLPMFAGAESTLRSDFVEVCQKISAMGYSLDILTNGIRFANKDFALSSWNAGLRHACIGLNHWSYQGTTIHNKQLAGIRNLLDIGYTIGYIGYTMETLDHVPDILEEIETIRHSNIWHYRIRCGSFIGRSSDQERSYLSNLLKRVEEYYGSPVEYVGSDDNPYHIMVRAPTGAILRLIQWPDVTNIDMEELNTGPWCQFYNGPITNFVHQVITRDAYKNMKLPQKDTAPKRYQYKPINETGHDYWKHGWTGPIEVTELDWSYIDLPKKQFDIKIESERRLMDK
jgi:hypothetical protein